MARGSAVSLISGGLDSCVAAAWMIREGWEVAALHCTYGQRTEARELRAFGEICDALGIEQRRIADLGHLVGIGGSSLTDPAIPVSEADLESTEIPTSYVPFRNGNMLAVAASWAEVLAAEAIGIGAVEEDSSGYPDCRRSFFDAMERVIELGTRPGFNPRIVTPLITLTKAEIVGIGLGLEAPLEKTWSCYRDGEKACGTCDSCALRLRGFRQAGVEDPLPYRTGSGS